MKGLKLFRMRSRGLSERHRRVRMIVYILKVLNKEEYFFDKTFETYADAEQEIVRTNRHYLIPVKACLTISEE